jgi:oxygen-independent coproporphyrinogen-3 oxidase
MIISRWPAPPASPNLNVDLIYGLPGQTLRRWQETLEAVLAWGPEHLSAYALIVEERTALHRWIREGADPGAGPGSRGRDV